MPNLYKKSIFDNLHGNIVLTRVEDRILKSPYYQRLRWIKQLGFTFYIYSGATHTRFSHALGVLHIIDRLLKSVGKSVADEKLYDTQNYSPDVVFHRTMRLAAMLHDIGTFPFSHTIELAYINHAKKQRQNGLKVAEANHEELGSHILTRTDFKGGLTRILKEEGIDPVELSQIIAGKSRNLLANQLVHSDVDADRMDYLLRDAHHTGIRYGVYDLEQLIRNMTTASYKGHDVLCVNEIAQPVVEYFLISRFYWYSQIIEDGTGYKFDLIAAKIYEYFLENGMAHPFEELISKVTQDPAAYFTFNDSYFLAKLHEYLAGEKNHPVIQELAEMLAFREAPKQIKIGPLQARIISSQEERQAIVKSITEAAHWLEEELKALNPKSWMILDLPKREVMFTKDHVSLKRDLKGSDPLLARDSAKILTRDGELKLLIDMSNSLLFRLAEFRNFIPRIYLSTANYELLEKHNVLEAMKIRYKDIGVAS